MKQTKLLVTVVFAAMALALAGPVLANGANGANRASSVRGANYAARNGTMGNRAGMRAGNRRFFNNQFPYYSPYGYGYGYGYGNQVYLNPDEADWSEQWGSLYQDNNGPYARSAQRGNPLGPSRVWDIPDGPEK
jgi:hypothetical protein